MRNTAARLLGSVANFSNACDAAPPTPIAYPPAEAAIASGRSRTRIFEAIKNGEIIARKDGKATLIEHEELVRWVKSLPVLKAKPAASAHGGDAND